MTWWVASPASRCRRRCPTPFFDRADEVVLVDTTADELIERLAAGKVYLPAQAERAARTSSARAT